MLVDAITKPSAGHKWNIARPGGHFPRGSTKTLSSKDKDKVVGVGQGQYKDKEYEVFSIKYKEWVVTNIRIKSE